MQTGVPGAVNLSYTGVEVRWRAISAVKGRCRLPGLPFFIRRGVKCHIPNEAVVFSYFFHCLYTDHNEDTKAYTAVACLYGPGWNGHGISPYPGRPPGSSLPGKLAWSLLPDRRQSGFITRILDTPGRGRPRSPSALYLPSSRRVADLYFAALQRQTAVSAYFSSKQILLFAFAWQSC